GAERVKVKAATISASGRITAGAARSAHDSIRASPGPPERLSAGVADDEALGQLLDRPGRREAGVVPSLLAGEQRRQHLASQLGDDEPQALALNHALDDQPRSGPCAVAGGPGACRKAEQWNAFRRVQVGR